MKEDITELFGEVLSIEEDTVQILCLLIDDPSDPYTQVRSFPRIIVEGVVPLEICAYCKIRIVIKPGSQLTTIEHITEDLSVKFKMKDHFVDYDQSKFCQTHYSL